MPIFLTDAEIAALIAERKPLPQDGDFAGAISCMLKDCGFEFPAGSTFDLFRGAL
jgi:hypothetical protein